MQETGLPPIDATLATLWGPRRIIDDAAFRLAVVIGLAILLLALRPLAAVAGLSFLLLALAVRDGGGRSVLTLAICGGAIALGLNALTEPGRILYSAGPLRITAEGLAYGGGRAVRLAGLVALGRLAGVWVDAWSLAELAEGSGRRSAGGRLLAQLALTAGLALRMMPVVRREAIRLERAGRIRPGGEGGRGVRARVRGLAGLFLPLLAGTIRRAEEVARTLDARGYGCGPRSSRLAPVGSGRRWGAVALVGLSVLFLLLLGRL